MEWLYTSVPVRLRLSEGGWRALWTWRRRQDQAFNMAVEMALALEPDEPAPSRFTAWNRLTARAPQGRPGRASPRSPHRRRHEASVPLTQAHLATGWVGEREAEKAQPAHHLADSAVRDVVEYGAPWDGKT